MELPDGRTHFVGCHAQHLDCALAKLAEAHAEVGALRKQSANLHLQLDELTPQLSKEVQLSLERCAKIVELRAERDEAIAVASELRKDRERLEWILNDEFARYDPFFKDYRRTLQSREDIDAAMGEAKGNRNE